MTDKFIEDRRRGREGQDLVAQILQGFGLEVENVPDGMFPDYDLKTNTGVTVEVKMDLMAAKTGNICLELEALDHSKADLLAIVVKPPVTIYFKELPKVRQFAHSWHKFVRGGEFNGEMALVPRSIFIDRMKPGIITPQPNDKNQS